MESTPYKPAAKEDVWTVADMLMTARPLNNKGELLVQGKVLSYDWGKRAAATVLAHQIEILSRPSKRPSQPPIIHALPNGGEWEEWSRGASRLQLDFQRKFFERKGHERTAPTYYCIAGGNRCLGPDTIIESPDGQRRRVADIKGEHEVWAWDRGRRVRATAHAPFIKAREMCYRVRLSNGGQFDCSENHRLLGADGLWHSLREWLPTSYEQGLSSLFLPVSSWGSDLLVHELNVSRWMRKLQGSRFDYHSSRCSGGGQLRCAKDDAQGAFPSQGDARAHSPHYLRADDLVPESERTRPYQSCDHPSIQYVQHQSEARFVDTKYRGACKSSIRSDSDSQFVRRSIAKSFQTQPTRESVQSATTTCPKTGWPLLMSPDGFTAIVSCVQIGCQPIYDFEVPTYHNYVTCGTIHHNSGKSITTFALCFCLDIRDHARNNDVFWAIAPTDKKLIDDVQEWIWKYLPRSMFGDRMFSKEIGFGQNKTLELILPGGRGTCKLLFKTEEQMVTNPGVFEASSVNGIVWTEARYEPLVSSLRTRVLDKRGYILVDYLPCEGWHQQRFELNPMVHHVTFGMHDNQHNLPPGEIEKFIAENAHDPDAIALRVYGKPRAMMGVVIKSFDRNRHVIKPFKIPHWWPLYMAGDWGFDHPHAFGIMAVAPNNDIYIIDEEYRSGMYVDQTVLALWNMLGRYRTLRHVGASPESMFDEIRKIVAKGQQIEQDEGEYRFLVQDPDLSLVEHVRAEFTKTLANGYIAIDSQVFQKRGENYGMTLGQQFLDLGCPIDKAVKGEIEWSVETLRRRFHDDKMFVFENCVNVKRDLAAWKYKRGADGRTVGSKDRYEEQFKDGVDFCRYGLQMNPVFKRDEAAA